MLSYKQTFSQISLDELKTLAQKKKKDGARFIELHASTLEDGFMLTYAFTDDETITDNYNIKIAKGELVPAISPIFLAAFIFENETHDLFGIEFDGIAIDFKGSFYQVSLETPMAVPTQGDDEFAMNRKYDAMQPVKQRGGE